MQGVTVQGVIAGVLRRLAHEPTRRVTAKTARPPYDYNPANG